jgi:chitinase
MEIECSLIIYSRRAQALPLAGASEYYDEDIIAAWCYNDSTRTMVSYDTPRSVTDKIKYIEATELGGAMWWDTTGDVPGNTDRSLIPLARNSLAGPGAMYLEFVMNVLDYPQSKYDNIRNQMNGGSGSKYRYEPYRH